ncbi:MAG TPA: hypothetical protein VHU80_16520, partial [Polyangiaceae bacterium]|nr:hypothetical protein [Polyangiaceae bacterium]
KLVNHKVIFEAEKALASAQERYDEELLEAQKLGTIGKLAGGIAHDFNNRLVIIMGHGELLKRDCRPTVPSSSTPTW